MHKIEYKHKKITPDQSKYAKELEALNVHPILAQLYSLRGIKDYNQINLVQKLEPWSNMKNIEEAAKLITNSIKNKERICIVADYDVDGATACTIGIRGLQMLGGKVDYIVPNRFVHGYGLTPSVVDEAIKKRNPDLIVTVDNGISSIAGVQRAIDKGIKVLITDHHLAGDTLPIANCIVNPNQPGCQFKSKSMAGCGVMFYVLAATRQYMIDIGLYQKNNAPNIFSLLDLVAVGTIADVVKLDTNNRILVKLGLDLIHKKQTRAGIIALSEVAKKNIVDLTTQDIAFGIAPRINAAGRLEDMSIGIQTLLTENPIKAMELAKTLNDINTTRKMLEDDMKTEALELPKLNDTEYSKIAYSDSFHEGVIGIVASRIKEMFYRPSIVFAPSTEEGYLKGSGRSIPEIHLRDALDLVSKKSPDIIAKFGGHAMAAGLTIKKSELNNFTKLFDESVKYFLDGRELQNIKEIDMTLETKNINMETATQIQKEIWGQGFNYPLFSGKFKIIDQKILKDAHLKLLLEKDNQTFEGIWFFNNQKIEKESAELIYTLSINEFLGNKTVQLLVEGFL